MPVRPISEPTPDQAAPVTPAPVVFRLRHEVVDAPARPAGPGVATEPLPEPDFPRHPELLTDEPWPGDGIRHWTRPQIMRAVRGWAVPYFRSRLLPGDFHPIVAYLFTEYKCNL